MIAICRIGIESCDGDRGGLRSSRSSGESRGRPVDGARAVTNASRVNRGTYRVAHRPRTAVPSPNARAQAPKERFLCIVRFRMCDSARQYVISIVLLQMQQMLSLK